MNLFERAFFSMFLLWSNHRDEKEFAGSNALMTFGLSLSFNIATILILIVGFDIIEFTGPIIGSKKKWAIVSVAWFGGLAILFLRKSQLKRYRARIKELSEDQIKSIKRKAIIYAVSSIVGGLIVAFSVTAYLDN